MSHNHYSLESVRKIINRFKVPEKVKEDAYNVYKLIAEAESWAHHEPVEEVHFHEVGAIDAIVDILTVCYLIDRLGIDEIYATPIATGSGYVKCEHGILEVPAPATAYLLKDIPHYHGDIESELCTPTGAALLKYFVKDYVDKVEPNPTKIGIGFGKKRFNRPNIIQANYYDSDKKTDTVIELQSNIDDMTGEELGYALNKLLNLGAKDVFIEPIIMKKNRPGYLLSVLTDEKNKEKIIEGIFKYTSTLGIRESIDKRYILDREEIKYRTDHGVLNKKITQGYNIKNSKFEFDDLTALADSLDLSIKDIRKILQFYLYE